MTGETANDTSDGLIVQLPPAPGAEGRWWRVGARGIEGEGTLDPGGTAPWGDLGEGARITAIVPAALAPVADKPLPEMPLPQALAAERLERAGEAAVPGERHVAVAAHEGRLLSCAVSPSDMDTWLAECAARGIEPASLVPAALALPRPVTGLVGGTLGAEPLARTTTAAFAGEPALVEALAGDGEVRDITDDAVLQGMLVVHGEAPLDLRQGRYAPRRVSFFRLPDWGRLARMAALAALLALVLMLAWIIKWNVDSSAQEADALAAAQKHFPAATDLDSAERLASAEVAKRGLGASGFSAPAAALLAAMRAIPGVSLRDLGFSADGTLRFTAAAPRAEDINALLLSLQEDGWKVTVPPALAPDPTGATVAAITLRAQ
ncbi:type II secretion system protein GspL [Novosphingobium sp. ZN18A2]|uniref:type II secretion system protein GspL n=1 Tax=Novosphingobium sp. ZN18A2 TaxID=3079861 RepID=UPI0030D11D8D